MPPRALLTSRPSLAVVIATRNRPQLLARCLEGLAVQRQPAAEVIVVDDGSTGATSEVLSEFAHRLPLAALRHERATGQGVARNDGWRTATCDYIAFTDDDCRPDPGWLEAMSAVAAPWVVVVGRTVPDPLDAPATSILDWTMRVDADDGRFSTCNVLYPRDVLETTAGFDAGFGHAIGEDTDLGQRALSSGARGIFSPEAVVYHAIRRNGVWPSVRHRWRSGGVVRLAKHYPHLRTTVWHGRYWKAQHPDAIRAMLGVLLMPLTPATLIAAQDWLEDAPGRLEWATHNYLGASRAQRIRETATLALLEAVEIASCARASLRHRTFFL